VRKSPDGREKESNKKMDNSQPSHQTHLSSRPFLDDADFWRIRDLAIETYPITGPGWNWDIRRWDGERFYDQEPVLNPNWQRNIRLWETEEGRLVGAVNGYRQNMFYLQLHPDFRQVEEEMIAWAEQALPDQAPAGLERQIHTEVYEYDAPRSRILARRGFEKLPEGGVFRKMRVGSGPLPEVRLAEGYLLRSIHHEDQQDCQRLADLLNASFNRSFHNAGEFYQFARLAPCYRQDLHQVAEAPDGSFAAHVAVIYDEKNRRGLFEPVCTHPLHRRNSLAQALMLACLHRLQAIGAGEVTVETGEAEPANALYDTIGFTEVYKSFLWRKRFEE
jgi:GNAT superfamily N-acetyltransferase